MTHGTIENRRDSSPGAVTLRFDAPIPMPATPIDATPTSIEWAARSERRVLVVASRFPPVVSAGAIRVRKFVKDIGRHGWRPTVITGAMRGAPVDAHDARRACDLEGLHDLPADLAIHRLGAFMDHWPTHLARVLAIPLSSVSTRWGWDSPRWTGFLVRRMQRIYDRFSFPDREIWRLPLAVRLALTLHRRQRFNALFTTGLPFSDHLIGLVLSAILRLPWVADLRDPWAEYAQWQRWQSAEANPLARLAETSVIRRATRVICASQSMTDRFVHRYGGVAPRKFLTIPDGFDPHDFQAPPAPGPRADFRLLHVGSFERPHIPSVLLQAFRRFLQLNPGSELRATLELVGRPGPIASDRTACDKGRVHHLGMLSHGAAMRRMAEADANIIFDPGHQAGAGDSMARACECLGSGRPILAAVPNHGETTAVLSGVEGVWQCDPDDEHDIARAICQLYRKWLAGDVAAPRPARTLAPLTWQRQTERLAACLNEAVNLRSPRG